GTLQYTGGAVTTDRLFSVGTNSGTLDASGSGAVNFSNTGSMAFNGQTGTRSLTLTGSNTGANTLAAIIGDNGGATTLNKTGAGEWVLSGTNTYTGTTNITGGTLQVTNSNALGSLPGGAVNISNGGTLDIGGGAANAINFSTKQFNISGSGVGGNGAIVNSSATNSQNNAFQNITLTGDATIGGSSRWDMRGGTPALNLGTNTLTKTGSNQISIVAGNITGNGNIVVNQGEFAIQTGTNATGSGTFTFNNGATLGLWNNTGNVTTAMAFNGTSTVLNESGASTIASPMTVNGTTTFNVLNAGTTPSLTLTGQLTVNGAAVFAPALGTSLTLQGPLAGTGTATMNGAGNLILGANQVFNSTLNLNAGTLSLAGFDLTLTTLHITGNSTIDFGSGLASILDTTNFLIDPGVTLTVTNWANTLDYFYSTNNPGLTSLSQIVF
ncbi:MAG TPA: autotransporter-associated beta strand repeat-containing protein, partial [Verrucomicrobiae bacterium]|nr:autotransporter-associated beta strand repeat-containing protein [Verrucomicrobiae bacterium]